MLSMNKVLTSVGYYNTSCFAVTGRCPMFRCFKKQAIEKDFPYYVIEYVSNGGLDVEGIV